MPSTSTPMRCPVFIQSGGFAARAGAPKGTGGADIAGRPTEPMRDIGNDASNAEASAGGRSRRLPRLNLTYPRSTLFHPFPKNCAVGQPNSVYRAAFFAVLEG